jgi:hypothetical protein
MSTEIHKCSKCGVLLPEKVSTCWNCERIRHESGPVKFSDRKDSLKSFAKVVGILFIGGVFISIILAPINDSSNKNSNININYGWQNISIPERYGYLGGIFQFDTLEIYEKFFLIKKHGALSNETITLPFNKVQKIVLGNFLGQKYIKIEYEGGFFGDSYKLYTNTKASSEYFKSYFANNRIIIEDNWK